MSVRPTEPATAEDLAAMRSQLDLRRRDHVRVAAMLSVLGLGLRRGEVCALNIGDCRKHEGYPVLDVVTLKKRRTSRRLVPVAERGARLLAKYVDQQHGADADPGAPLFVTCATHHPCTARRLTPKAVSYWVTKLRLGAGIDKRLTPHSLRHAFATRLLQSEEPVDLTGVDGPQRAFSHAGIPPHDLPSPGDGHREVGTWGIVLEKSGGLGRVRRRASGNVAVGSLFRAAREGGLRGQAKQEGAEARKPYRSGCRLGRARSAEGGTATGAGDRIRST